MTKKITMQSIADNIGLSKAVVSRALSGKYGVSERTKALVWSEAARLGYPIEAKNMNKLGNNAITVFIPRASFTDENFSTMVLSGIEKTINNLNMHMILVMVENETKMPASHLNGMPSVLETQGIIVFSQIEETFLNQLQKIGLPIVLVDFIYRGIPFPSTLRIDHVLANNYWGMYSAAKYLVDKGHRRLLFVGSISYSYSFLQRYHGCYDYIQTNPQIECRYVISKSDGPVTFNSREFDETIDTGYFPDAIICGNDVTALDIYKKLFARGLKIPDDISVIGFDNIEKCTWVTPHLTTMMIRKYDLGVLAVSTLVDRIQHPRPYFTEILLDVELVERDSVRDRT